MRGICLGFEKILLEYIIPGRLIGQDIRLFGVITYDFRRKIIKKVKFILKNWKSQQHAFSFD